MQCAQCVSNHNIYLRAHILVYTGFTMRWVSSSLSSLEVLRDLFPRSPAVPITRDCGLRASRKSPTRAAFTSPLQSAVRGGQQGPSFMRCTAHIYIYMLTSIYMCMTTNSMPIGTSPSAHDRPEIPIADVQFTHKEELAAAKCAYWQFAQFSHFRNKSGAYANWPNGECCTHSFIYIYILRDVAHPIQREGGECETKPSTGVE